MVGSFLYSQNLFSLYTKSILDNNCMIWVNHRFFQTIPIFMNWCSLKQLPQHNGNKLQTWPIPFLLPAPMDTVTLGNVSLEGCREANVRQIDIKADLLFQWIYYNGKMGMGDWNKSNAILKYTLSNAQDSPQGEIISTEWRYISSGSFYTIRKTCIREIHW